MSKDKTKSTAETTVATVAPPAAPVDPVQVLAERQRRKAAEAWQQARPLLLRPQLTEADVCRLADLLETSGLPAALITLFRTADQLRTSATATGRDVERLAQERQGAEKKLQEAQAALKSEMARLEQQIIDTNVALRDAMVKQGAAVDARNLAENLSGWFAPLWDAEMGVSDFALPPQTIGPGFPQALRDGLQVAGLLDGQQRVSAVLRQPLPVRTPPNRVLLHHVAPNDGHAMSLAQRPQSAGTTTIGGVETDSFGRPVAAARPPSRDLAGRLIPTQLTQPNDR